MKVGSKHITRRAAVVTTVGTAVLIAGGTVAWSATATTIPGPDGVIHSCYNATGSPAGSLRVIDPATGARCAKNEKPLDFNQTGPRGSQGIQGFQGVAGVDGTDGVDGVDGTDGQNGAPGVTGPAGVSGYQIVSAQGASDQSTVDVTCPIGKRAISGGGYVTPGGFLRVSAPAFNGFGWTATGSEDEWGSDFHLATTTTVYAVCATVAP